MGGVDMGCLGAGEVSEYLNVAVCQMTSIDDLEINRSRIFSMLDTLEGECFDLICFPENSIYLRIEETDSFPVFNQSHPLIQDLLNWSVSHQAAIHLGSVPLTRNGKMFNSSVLLLPNGSIVDLYDKIHLFDVDVLGQKSIRESAVFEAGKSPFVFEYKGWKFGSSICYDIRFAELYVKYAFAEVDVILIPSAFIVPTGRAHWQVLTRARAIESQAYVLAAAQGGVHKSIRGGVRETYGHSMIVDPWGLVLGEFDKDKNKDEVVEEISGAAKILGNGVMLVTLSRERVRHVRRQIPMSSHRRLK
jgi:predicted amidohydrolase